MELANSFWEQYFIASWSIVQLTKETLVLPCFSTINTAKLLWTRISCRLNCCLEHKRAHWVSHCYAREWDGVHQTGFFHSTIRLKSRRKITFGQFLLWKKKKRFLKTNKIYKIISQNNFKTVVYFKGGIKLNDYKGQKQPFSLLSSCHVDTCKF